MKYDRQKQVREALRAAPDGMTVAQLVAAVATDRTHISRVLSKMPDAYIDRWETSPAGLKWYSAVWCVVTPPDNCPRPKSSKKLTTNKPGRPRNET